MRLRIGSRRLLCLCLLCGIVCLSSCGTSAPDVSSDQSDEPIGTVETGEIDLTNSPYVELIGIPLEPDKTDLPSYAALNSIRKGMTKDEVFALAGNPQRAVFRQTMKTFSDRTSAALVGKSVYYVYNSSEGTSLLVEWGFAGSLDSEPTVCEILWE